MRTRAVLQSVVGLLVGAVILWALTRGLGSERLAGILEEADLRLLLGAQALFLSQTLTMGFRWWLTMRLLGQEVRLVSLVRANSASNVLNFVAPGHFGEPAASLWLGRTGRGAGLDAFAVLVACKIVATIVNLLLLIGCVATLGLNADLQASRTVVGAAVLLVLAGLLAVMVSRDPRFGALSGRFAGRVVGLVARPFDQGTGRALRARSRVEELVVGLLRALALVTRSPVALLASTAVSVLKLASLIGAMLLTYQAIGQPITLVGATFLETVDSLGTLMSVWIPGNLGVQEAVTTSAAVAGLSIEGDVAFSAALLTKAMIIVHVAFGAVVWWGLGPLDRRPAAVTEGDRVPPAGP